MKLAWNWKRNLYLILGSSSCYLCDTGQVVEVKLSTLFPSVLVALLENGIAPLNSRAAVGA